MKVKCKNFKGLAVAIPLFGMSLIYAGSQEVKLENCPESVKTTLSNLKASLLEVEKKDKGGVISYKANLQSENGRIMLKMDQEGEILKRRDVVMLKDVPEKVSKIIQEKAAGKQIKEVAKVISGDKKYFEVEFVLSGRKSEMRVDENGHVLEEK